MKTIKFTVVTVCFNAQKTISKTVNSVLAQDYDNYEYIIIDGASTDSTLKILNSVRDDHLKIKSEPDKGIYDAMNKALDMSSGDFLIFLGSDDLFYSKAVLSNVSKRIKSYADIVYGNVVQMKGNVVYSGKFSRWMWGYKNICHQSIFYPRNIYKSQQYKLKYRLAADWAYNLELLRKGYKYVYVNQLISFYNNVDGASSNAIDEVFLRDRKKLIISAVGKLPYYYGLVRKIIKCFLKKIV